MYMFSKKKSSPPKEAFLAATTNNREAFGIAVAYDDSILLTTGALDWEDEAQAIKTLTEYAESYKDGLCLFWFSDEVVKTEQPFVVFDQEVEFEDPENKGKMKTETTVHTVAAFAGDFSKHEDVNSPESAAFLCFQKLVKPRCDEIATKVEGDIDAFHKYIEDHKDNADAFLDGVLSDDSAQSLCLLVSNGLTMNFESGEAPGKMFSWGYMSDPSGYAEATAKATGLVPKGKLGLKPKNVTTEMDKATGKIVLISMNPPKHYKTMKELVGFYQTWNYARDSKGVGIVPENPQKRPAIEVDKAKWEADPNFRSVAASATATATPPSADPQGGKVALSGNGASIRPKEGVHAVTFKPTLSAKEKAELTAGWLNEGFINDAGSSTTTLAADEHKVPTFAEITGVSFNDLLRHTPTSIDFLTTNHPKLATNLIVELLRLCETKNVLVPSKAKSPVVAGKKLLPKPKAA